MIKKSWEKLHKLDLTTSEWKFLQFRQSIQHINDCNEAILKECGKYLKRIVINDTSVINSLSNRCKHLETIIIHGDPLYSNHLTVLANSYSELTKIHMNIEHVQDEMMCLIFNSNQNLKSLFLQEGFIEEFEFLQNLNPHVLETLQFNLSIDSHTPQSTLTTFLTVIGEVEWF